MVVEPQETAKPPTTRRKESKWERIKREALFWTSLTANTITIFFFIYKFIKNGN